MAVQSDTKTLKAGKSRLIAITVGNLASAGIGLWLYQRDHSTTGLWLSGICSLLAIATAVQLLPGASELVLDSEGFSIKALFRTQRYRWADVTGFTVGKIGLNKMVMFNLTDEFKAQSEAEKAAGEFMKNINGHEAALPANYGMSPEDLSQLLNRWHERRSKGSP
jgi:hypothetical protein